MSDVAPRNTEIVVGDCTEHPSCHTISIFENATITERDVHPLTGEVLSESVVEYKKRCTSVGHLHSDLCVEHALPMTHPVATDRRRTAKKGRAVPKVKWSNVCDACLAHPAVPASWAAEYERRTAHARELGLLDPA